MSTLVDDAISKAKQTIPEVDIRNLAKSCGLMGRTRANLDAYTEDVARRAAHAKTYRLENDDAELLGRLAALRKDSCELHVRLVTLFNSIADEVDAIDHVPFWGED